MGGSAEDAFRFESFLDAHNNVRQTALFKQRGAVEVQRVIASATVW
jgi:hypothetical protein